MTLNDTQRKILCHLFFHPNIHRKDLAKAMSVTLPALTLSLKKIFHMNLIVSEKELTGRVGRSQERISLNKEIGDFIGIDIRRHHFDIACIDFSGKLLLSASFTKEEEAVRTIADTISQGKIKKMFVDYRGEETIDTLRQKYPLLFSLLDDSKIPYRYENNIETLARVYDFYHRQDSSFLFIKYGPGLGSSVFLKGQSMKNETGHGSQLGNVYLADGKTLEEHLSFESLLKEDIEEAEGYPKLKADPVKMDYIEHLLALAVVDADSFLPLDRIIFAGLLLSDKKTVDQIKKKTTLINPDFSVDKIMVYPQYSMINERKGAVAAFMSFIKDL